MKSIKVDKDLEDIMPEFLEHRKKDLEILQNAINKSEFNEVRIIGHRLAGNAPSYGLDDLGPIGDKLEEAARNQDKQTIVKLINEYKAYIKDLKIVFE